MRLNEVSCLWHTAMKNNEVVSNRPVEAFDLHESDGIFVVVCQRCVVDPKLEYACFIVYLKK